MKKIMTISGLAETIGSVMKSSLNLSLIRGKNLSCLRCECK
mgnify:CR=1 FL=1